MKLSPTLVSSTVIAAMGGFLFGFDMSVISGTTDDLVEIFNLDSARLDVSGFWLGFTVASALIGTVVGAMVAGRPADKWGRRSTLIVLAAFYFVSAVGSAMAWNWVSFLAFRFLGGLAVGGASVVSPMYIAEISPAPWRGRLVAVQQLNIVLGILLAFASNYAVAQFELGEATWRWMFGVEAFPAAAFFVLLFITPESPRWLVARGRVEEARGVLERLGTDIGPSSRDGRHDAARLAAPTSVDQEIAAIESSLALARHELVEPLFQRAYAWPIFLAVAIAAFNQLSGINALMYYGPTIFKMAGAGTNAALLQAVVIGFTNLVVTILAMIVIDYFGRKKLMIVGSLGYIMSLATTAWAFHHYGDEFDRTGGLIVLVSLVVFIASHAFGQGAVIWVFISEIFPNRVRARGVALGCFTHWIMNALISWSFPVFANTSGALIFGLYAAMMVLQLLWVLVWMPETKGVPLEEIQKRLEIE